MAKTKKSNRRKKKSWLKLSPAINLKNPIVLLILLAVVAGGTFWVYKSRAEDIGQPLLVSRIISDGGEVGDGELLVEPDTTSFMLYENGLALCGDYPDTDTKHTAQYYSKQLSEKQKNDFVTSISNTGFLELNEIYAPDSSITDINNVNIAVSIGGKQISVLALPGYVSIPAAFTTTNALIDDFCANLDTPYVPKQVVVKSKVTPREFSQSSSSNKPRRIDVKSNQQINRQVISGNDAKSLYFDSGKKGSKFYRDKGEVVQTVVAPIPPKAQAIQSKGQMEETGFKLGATPLIAATPQAEIYTLCPSDVPLSICDNSPTSGAFTSRTKAFYERHVGKIFEIRDGGRYVGKNTRAWYQTCHGYYGDNCASDAPRHILYNLKYELINQRGLKNDRPRNFIIGYNTGPRPWCGVAFIGQNGQGDVGIFDDSVTRPGYTCGEATEFGYVALAHEVGHTLGLTHSPNGGELMWAQANPCPAGLSAYCKLNYMQHLWLRAVSPWFHF